jgi:hypothetical protein
MAEIVQPPFGPPGAPNRAFDPRLNNLVLTFVTPDLGGAAASHDATLEVVNGEGQVWLDPTDLPTLGEITSGQLTIASENFPAYAPLTLNLHGVELRLLAERSSLLAGGFYIDGRSVLRLQCAGMFDPGLVYSLHWPAEQRLVVRRWDLRDANRQYDLELEVLHGAVAGDRPRAGNIQGGADARVTYNRIRLEPVDGLLRLRLIAARFVLDFHNGQAQSIHVFNGLGFVAAFAVRDLRGLGSALSVSFRDTIN